MPGVFFVCYGLAWIILSFWNHLSAHPSKSTTNGPAKPSNKLTYAGFKREIETSRKSYLPHYCCLGSCPLEPIIKVLLSFVGILLETFLDYDKGSLVFKTYSVYSDRGSYSKLHHITMYSSFLLAGVVDLAMLFVRLPKHTSKCFLSLAFLVEGILFLNHVEGKGDLGCFLHHLLTFIIFSCLLFSVLRLLETSNLCYNGGLGVSITLQGMWFIQVGVILYGHTPWDYDDPSSIKFAIACLAWHIIVIAIVTLLLYVVMMACLRSTIKYHRKAGRSSTVLPLAHPLSRGTPQEREKLMIEERDKEMNDLSRPTIFADTAT